MARQPFNTRWAQGVESQDNLNTFKMPPSSRLGSGWEGGQDKDAPAAGHENWWHNRVDSALQDLERKGVMTWVATAPYEAGAPTKGSDNNFYESLASDNLGNNPVGTTGFWRFIGASLYTNTPVGTSIIAFHNGIPDAGWLKCNGAVLLRSSYPALFNRIGTSFNTGGELSTQFRLPDTRGQFLRGFDDGRGLDINRVFGIAQDSQNLSHAHTGTTSSAGSHAHSFDYQSIRFTGGSGAGGGNAFQNITVSGGTASAGSHTHAITLNQSGGAESRPVNLTCVYWIKT